MLRPYTRFSALEVYDFSHGHPNAAIALYEEALAAWYATGMRNHTTEFLCVQAEIYGKASQPQRGISLINEAFDFMQKGGERYHEAELYRMRGILHMQMDTNNISQAEADFSMAIRAAKRMKARMCELRATVSLCLLWKEQAKIQPARKKLSTIYNWFTEGFDTRDMLEAKELLDALG